MNQTPATTAQGIFPSPVAAKLQGLLRKLNPAATEKTEAIAQAFPVPVTEEPAAPKTTGKSAAAKDPAATTPKRVKSRSREDLEKEVSELMFNLGMDPTTPEKPPQWLQAQPSAPATAASQMARAKPSALPGPLAGAKEEMAPNSEPAPQMRQDGLSVPKSKTPPKADATPVVPVATEKTPAAKAQPRPETVTQIQASSKSENLNSPKAPDRSDIPTTNPATLQQSLKPDSVSQGKTISQTEPLPSPVKAIMPLRQESMSTKNAASVPQTNRMEPPAQQGSLPKIEAEPSANAFLSSLSDSDLQEMRGLLLQMKEVVGPEHVQPAAPIELTPRSPSSPAKSPAPPFPEAVQLAPGKSPAELPSPRLMGENVRLSQEGKSPLESRLAAARESFTAPQAAQAEPSSKSRPYPEHLKTQATTLPGGAPILPEKASIKEPIRNFIAPAQQKESTLKTDLSKPEIKADLNKPEIKAELNKPEIKAELSKPEIKAELSKPEIKAELNKPEIKADLSKPEIKADLSKPEIKADLSKPEIKADFSKPEIKADLSKPEIKAEIGRAHV